MTYVPGPGKPHPSEIPVKTPGEATCEHPGSVDRWYGDATAPPAFVWTCSTCDTRRLIVVPARVVATPKGHVHEMVPIVLVGGPLDGETLEIPAQDAGRIPWRFAAPWPSIAEMYVPDRTIPEPPRHLEYRPKTVDFNGWPVPSITDDGTMRYQYVGETW